MKKITLLGLAASCMALLSFPAGVSAGVWHATPSPTVEKPLKFIVQGGQQLWTTPAPGFMQLPCQSMTGAGEYNSKTTATLTLTFHGCLIPPFGLCGSVAQPAGTVTTTELVVHNITSGHKPAILITPNAATGFFTHSNCPFLETIKGNGIIAMITSPGCGQESKTATLSFNISSWGVQADRTITTSGTEYALERSDGEKMALSGHATMTFAESSTMTCT